ncbi:MAG: DJ-1/PfpI family protein [Fibrobacter sp.]|nr:DJ-1/PfpI family protein [Fibrobacter sp.]
MSISQKSASKTCVFLLANGFEDIEFVAPWDILKRGGVDLLSVSIHDTLEVKSAHELTVKADVLWSDEWKVGDMLVLPGGGEGTQNLRAHAGVIEAVQKQLEADRLVAAICAAPTVLGDAGVIKDRQVTCYPSMATEVETMAAKVLGDAVVESDKVITGRGPGVAIDFGFALLTKLKGEEVAAEVRAQMVF